MRGAGRMDHQRFYISYIGQQRKYLKLIDKALGSSITLDFKGKDRARTLREIFLIKSMVGIIR
jgi:hypothetical protein